MMKRLLVATVFSIAASSLARLKYRSNAQRCSANIRREGQSRYSDLEPRVSLLEGYATTAPRSSTKVFARDVDFCADMTPKWRQETGSLLATRMSSTSLNAPGVSPKDIELPRRSSIRCPCPEWKASRSGGELHWKADFGFEGPAGEVDLSLQLATDGRRNCGDRWAREVPCNKPCCSITTYPMAYEKSDRDVIDPIAASERAEA